MGHKKLKKFAENETFSCLLQPSSEALLADGYANLHDHEVKGRWNSMMFSRSDALPDSGLVLELGCGKGEYTIALAQLDPARNHVGVDIKGARLWKGAKFATQEDLRNVAFLRTRIEFISAFFGPGEVSQIWLTFSDPQFKSENSRLSSPVFLEKYRSFLRPDGVVHLKTDSRFLYEYTLAVCRANGLEILAATTDLYGSGSSEEAPSALELRKGIPAVATAVQTFYESMFVEQGYSIKYLAFSIGHEGAFVAPEDFDSDYWRSVEGPRKLFGHDTAETKRQKGK